MSGKMHEATVKIRGTTYQIRTDLEGERVQELAAHVDRTMNALDPKATLPPGKVSVLASLTIAGELLEEQRKTAGLREGMETRIGRLNRLLEEVLHEA